MSLTNHRATQIRQMVASGEIASCSDAIRAALRALWNEGVTSGESTPLNVEAIKRRGRERLAALVVADR